MRESGVLVVPNGLELASLTVSTTAVALAARVHPAHHYRRAVVQTDGTIRWSAASANPPTSTFGLLLEEGQTLVYDGDLATLKFIRDASQGTDVTLMIHYFGL